MNRYVDSYRIVYYRLNGEYVFGKRNKARGRVLDFALTYKLPIVNTFLER